MAHQQKGGGEGRVLSQQQRQLELVRERARRFGEEEERREGGVEVEKRGGV